MYVFCWFRLNFQSRKKEGCYAFLFIIRLFKFNKNKFFYYFSFFFIFHIFYLNRKKKQIFEFLAVFMSNTLCCALNIVHFLWRKNKMKGKEGRKRIRLLCLLITNIINCNIQCIKWKVYFQHFIFCYFKILNQCSGLEVTTMKKKRKVFSTFLIKNIEYQCFDASEWNTSNIIWLLTPF